MVPTSCEPIFLFMFEIVCTFVVQLKRPSHKLVLGAMVRARVKMGTR